MTAALAIENAGYGQTKPYGSFAGADLQKILFPEGLGSRPAAAVAMPSTKIWAAATEQRTVGVAGKNSSAVTRAPRVGLDGRLSQRLMDLKVQTAQIAMHLQPEWRSGFFEQLDCLLAEENWEPIDELPRLESHLTAMRLLIFLGEVERPGVGLSHDGHIILSWDHEGDTLTIECQSDDKVRWLISSRSPDGDREHVVGKSTSKRVPAVIAAYEPEKWLEIR